MGNIVLVGGNGYIGSNFSERLRNDSINFLNLSRSSGNDVTIWNNLEKLSNINLIYYFASNTTDIKYSIQNPSRVIKDDLTGITNMLEVARINKARFIFLSSSLVYGQPKYLPVDEKHPTNPESGYAFSKVISENICRFYSEKYDIDCMVLRVFQPYGNKQNDRYLIPTILKQLDKNEIILRNKTSKKDFLYIDDLVEVLYILLNKKIRGFEIINIGSGKSYSPEDIVNTISKIIGLEFYIKETEPNVGIMNVMANVKKAKELLGWEPKTSLEDGLRKILVRFK